MRSERSRICQPAEVLVSNKFNLINTLTYLTSHVLYDYAYLGCGDTVKNTFDAIGSGKSFSRSLNPAIGTMKINMELTKRLLTRSVLDRIQSHHQRTGDRDRPW